MGKVKGKFAGRKWILIGTQNWPIINFYVGYTFVFFKIKYQFWENIN